jgi:poly(A) polymerase
VDAVFDARIGDISGRGKLAADMREIWLMQPRFERRTAATAQSLVAQARFRAGYDFLRLRADCGELPSELADWWEDYHLGTTKNARPLLQDVRAASPPRGKRSAAGEPRQAGTEEAAEVTEGEGTAPSAPRKRRRRRRKPGGASAGAATGGGEGAPPAGE